MKKGDSYYRKTVYKSIRPKVSEPLNKQSKQSSAQIVNTVSLEKQVSNDQQLSQFLQVIQQGTTASSSVSVTNSPAVSQSSVIMSDRIIQPIIIGNANGAHMLNIAGAICNQRPFQSPAISVQNGQFMNFIPLFTQQNDFLITPRNSLSTTTLGLPACHKDQHLNNTKIHQNVKVIECSTKVAEGHLESEAGHRNNLCSSDTIILNPPTRNTPGTSSCSLSVNDQAEDRISAGDKPSVLEDKPFSLLKNISDRSVSLASIPSFSLFQPKHEGIKNININKSECGEKMGNCESGISETINAAYKLNSNEVAVVGSNNIPKSIIVLVKQHLKNLSPSVGNVICLAPPSEQNESNNHIALTAHNHIVSDCNASSTSEQVIIVQDEYVHNDARLQQETVPPAKNTKTNLTRADTIVVNEKFGNNFVCSGSQLQRSDTIVLTCNTDNNEMHSEDRLSEGFSFTSTNSSLSTFFEELIKEPSVNRYMPVEIVSNSISNQPTTMSYILTNDGYLAGVKHILSEPLDSTQLGQLGFISNVVTIPSVVSKNSLEASTKCVETKETQTDLVFGTNTIDFKIAGTTSDITTYEMVTQSSPAPTISVPLTVIESEGENNETLNQTQLPQQTVQLVIDPLPRSMSISLAEESLTSGVRLQKGHQGQFKCDLCSTSFKRLNNFNRHRKIHSLQSEKQQKYLCDVCGREFLQHCDMKRHLLIHTNQEPYRCEKCGKGYIRHSDLVVHLRFHNKEKTCVCTKCNKKFYQSGDLSRHMRQAHMPDSLLTCGHCNRKYAREATLIRHMKNAHKDIILNTVKQL